MKDMGNLKFFLGLEIDRSSKGISLCQRKYCADLSQDTNLLASKLVSTPMDPIHNLHFERVNLLSDLVCRLSQFLATPTNMHLQAAFKIVQLKNSPVNALFFHVASNLKLTGFSVSDYGLADKRILGNNQRRLHQIPS